MAKSQTTLRDENRDLTRRALIKWTVAAGAALGVSRSKVFDILERTAGKGVAYAAADNPTTRMFSLIGGNGGAAWWQLMWPQVDIAQARNPNFAWHKTGMEMTVGGTKNPLVIGPDTPWADLPAQKQVTCFLCGSNEAHTQNSTSNTTLNGNSIFAVVSALQASSPSVIPVVTIAGARLGTAPGAPPDSNVPAAAGITELFNSAASSATGLLAKATDAELYRAHYEAFIQLNRAANRSTTKAAYITASGAASFLGRNLSTRLAITPADRTRYGIGPGTRNNVAAVGNAMIVSVKAYAMGLTNAVIAPFMLDDPHTAFDAGDVNTVPAQLKGVFNGFMADLRTTLDEATGKPLADDLVMTMSGDTPKTCLSRGGWGDGTPGNTNNMYVYSSGNLFSGWFGSINRQGQVQGFGPDGKPAAYNGANTARMAMAAIAYAAAKLDERAISNFANGITVGGVFGRLKDS
jgi:hypothetical protein